MKALSKSYARRNLIDFTMYGKSNYKPNWHHYLIADRLEMVAKGEITRLIINLPPRHGKTELGTRRFPGWYFGNYDNKEMISISYNADLAALFGSQARDIIASHEYREIFDTELSHDNAAKAEWKVVRNRYEEIPCTKCGATNWHHKTFGRAVCRSCGALGQFPSSNISGFFSATGIDGSVSGKGAHVLNIDDPIKSRREAESKTYRKRLWDFYASTAYTRLYKNGGIVMILTRWHEDDLAGMVLRNKAEKWELLKLPAIADEDEEFYLYNQDYREKLKTDFVGRKKGEALWVSEFPLSDLEVKMQVMGSYEFSALYQQSPQPATGGLFKRKDLRYAEIVDNVIRLYTGNEYKNVPLDSCSIYATMDLGIVESEGADPTVLSTWAITNENDIVLIDCQREVIEAARHISMIHQSYMKHRHHKIGIERSQYQMSLVQQAKNDGLPVIELTPKGSKNARALPAAARMESGKVYFNKDLDNLREIEAELFHFPSGVHDDFVDTLSYIAEIVGESSRMRFGIFTKNKRL